MIVLKFGGTSIQSAEMIDQALAVAVEQLKLAPVMVCSAMGKTTDRLVEIAVHANNGETEKAQQKLHEVKELHYGTVRNFLTGKHLETALSRLNGLFEELSSLVKGLLLLKECTPRSNDALLSFGELLSTTIVYCRALSLNIDVELLDSRDFITTDDTFTAATPDIPVTYEKIQNGVKPIKDRLYIAQGFIGRNDGGATTTLGRGGSDFTAALFGAALAADEVQIWTDVHGIMTSDPRIVADAMTIPEISYEEAAELAYFGAKVVHPSTIQPAVEHNIPVHVKNTNDHRGASTTIKGKVPEKGLRAIAGKKDITLINITSTRMLNAYGFLRRMFSIFDTYKTPVDLIATSEVSVSLTIDNISYVQHIIKELQEIGKVTIEKNKSMLCLVGKNFWKDPAFVSRVFSTLSPTQIRLISLGSSDTNLSLVVQEDFFEDSILKLHREFF